MSAFWKRNQNSVMRWIDRTDISAHMPTMAVRNKITPFSGKWRLQLRDIQSDRRRFPSVFPPDEDDLLAEIEAIGPFAVEVFRVRIYGVLTYQACVYDVDRLGRHELLFVGEGRTRVEALLDARDLINSPDAA